MDITIDNFFYFSTETTSVALPAEYRFIRRLKALNSIEGREVALIRRITLSADFPPEFLVIIPRSLKQSIFHSDNNDIVFLYVLDGNKFVNSNTIDLTPGVQEPIDIGGIAFTKEESIKFQIKDSSQ